VADVIPVDVEVPGCPPPPFEILRAILDAVRRCRPASVVHAPSKP
jgi:Ni,Fe-hydrogenase III small subunit